MAEAEKDDWLDALDSPEEQSTVLDQSDLDSLLFDAKDQGQPAAGVEEELDQSAIDALLFGEDETLSAPAPQGASTEEKIDIGQSDIDDLLASPQKSAEIQEIADPDQDEIDKLFSEVDTGGGAEENPFLAEEIDFKDALEPKDSFPQSTNLNFDAEEFKFDAEIPDIPDTQGNQNLAQNAPAWVENTVAAPPADEPTAKIPFDPEPAASTTKGLDRQGLTAKVRKLLSNRKILVVSGVGLAAVLLGAGVFFIKGRPQPAPNAPPVEVASKPPHPEPAPPKPAEPVAAPTELPAAEPKIEAPAPPPTTRPVVEDLELTMPPESDQLQVTLQAKDPENDPLEYDFQSMPEHGQLSGHAPNLIYIPKPGFSGADGFTVRATDGKNISAPASIKIIRQAPVLGKETPAPAEAVKPATPAESTKKTEEASKAQEEIIQAKNKSYTLTKTNGQIINWKKLWGETNFVPYKADVRVNLLSTPKHGTVKAIDKEKSIYVPNQTFRGTDTFTYQFSLGKLTSLAKTISVTMKYKNRAPVLQVQPIAQSYRTGDTVILNASQTSDDQRETLTFKWEQLSGVPVLIKPVNREGSQIAFVAPANFNTVSNPSVLIKVTATDQEGASTSREIKVTTKSRRSSAIWNGL